MEGTVTISINCYESLKSQIADNKDHAVNVRKLESANITLSKTINEKNVEIDKLHDHIINEKVYISCVSKTAVIDEEDVLKCIELGITSDEIEAFISRFKGGANNGSLTMVRGRSTLPR